MFKACSKCGKIHDSNYQCTPRVYKGGAERKERSTYAWTKKSIEIRNLAEGLCEVCRDKGIYTYKGLEVHHIVKVRDDNTKLLDNYNLICLCTQHHKLAEDGKIKQSYLLELAKNREEK